MEGGSGGLSPLHKITKDLGELALLDKFLTMYLPKEVRGKVRSEQRRRMLQAYVKN